MNEFEKKLHEVVEAREVLIKTVAEMEAIKAENPDLKADKHFFEELVKNDFGADIRRAIDKLAALELRNRYDY